MYNIIRVADFVYSYDGMRKYFLYILAQAAFRVNGMASRSDNSEEADVALVPSSKRVRLESAGVTCREKSGMASNRVVLLLCGSFSPITNLHLRMLGEAQLEFH